jgi:ApaG protein
MTSLVTHNTQVSVDCRYAPEHSDVARGMWFFLYTVVIHNQGSKTIQLLNRHWVITDANGEVEEVRGEGVVGKQPTLKPKEAIEYTSGCPLKTPFGSMHGSYEMIDEDGNLFEVTIPPFALRDPTKMQ